LDIKNGLEALQGEKIVFKFIYTIAHMVMTEGFSQPIPYTAVAQ